LGKAEILEFVKTMHVKDHAILFYENRDDKRDILFTYLKAGLDAGEAAIYVASDEPTHDVARAMEEFGLNVDQYQKKHALRIVDYREWYIIEGEFNVSRVFSQWQRSLREALDGGFKGLRVAGEMSCFFRHHMLNELVVYERALHRELEVPMEAICAYDDSVVLRGIEEDRYLRLYLDLIAAHGTILFVGPEEAGVVRTV
jgi:hypothetical protein